MTPKWLARQRLAARKSARRGPSGKMAPGSHWLTVKYHCPKYSYTGPVPCQRHRTGLPEWSW